MGHIGLRKGFRVVGEYWCPLTWDLEKAFILWASIIYMGDRLSI